MRPDGWHLTEDLDAFLARAGDFLRSRPALHSTPLTAIERLRTRGADAYGAGATVFGRLERAGEVRAVFHRLPSRGLTLTPLTPEHGADAQQADPAVPPRRAHPAGAAPGGPWPGHGRAGP